MNWLTTGLTALVVLTVLGSLFVVSRLDPRKRRWRDVLEDRFVLGVPWGTLVVVGFVIAVYLFVQDGITDFDNPVVTPFRAWSFFYPLGILTAPFAHAYPGHLTGNLTGAIVVAPIAEYAWGHYANGSRNRSVESNSNASRGLASSLLTNPWLRALVVFPAGVIVVGVITGLFALGPVIGFSGVVFAFAGFAIVRYPIVTLIGAIGVHGTLSTIYGALQRPIGWYVVQPRPPSAPWWASTAIQGHALGFFVGLVVALVIFDRRDDGYRPDPLALWLAVLIYGFSKSLWAIYWFDGANRYVLFRGPGVVVVIALALVITVAVAGSQRSILPARLERRLSRPTAPILEHGGLLSRLLASDAATSDRLRELVAQPKSRVPSLASTSRQYTAVVVVFVVLAAICGPAIPVNLFVLDGDDAGSTEGTLTVEDYSITYAEKAQNPIASVVDLEAFDAGGVEGSGVIVSSPDRHIWSESVSAQRLAFSGSETVHVGGPGWRESITATRAGWTPVGNDTVYQVWLEHDDRRVLAHASEPSTANAIIDGKNVTIVPDDGAFILEVSANESADPARADIPAADESVTVDGLEFTRQRNDLFVTTGETTVQIASKETYN
ncbi:rhomboid family intramembrane serine protease [Saliphagus sp. GCM10025334]